MGRGFSKAMFPLRAWSLTSEAPTWSLHPESEILFKGSLIRWVSSDSQHLCAYVGMKRSWSMDRDAEEMPSVCAPHSRTHALLIPECILSSFYNRMHSLFFLECISPHSRRPTLIFLECISPLSRIHTLLFLECRDELQVLMVLLHTLDSQGPTW